MAREHYIFLEKVDGYDESLSYPNPFRSVNASKTEVDRMFDILREAKIDFNKHMIENGPIFIRNESQAACVNSNGQFLCHSEVIEQLKSTGRVGTYKNLFAIDVQAPGVDLNDVEARRKETAAKEEKTDVRNVVASENFNNFSPPRWGQYVDPSDGRTYYRGMSGMGETFFSFDPDKEHVVNGRPERIDILK